MNIINAIINLVKNQRIDIKSVKSGKNRANNMGDALEAYITNLFADSFDLPESQRDKKIAHEFSYKGNTSNPPDLMLFCGDAIEIKKIESSSANLSLNSSYPKHKLFASSSMITKSCKEAEDNIKKWKEKDIIYAVGVVKSSQLQRLCFVYGTEYAASEEIYQRIGNRIKQGLKEMTEIELAKTEELGRLNRVDPLGITYLRIRGMWGIENPWKVFSSHYTPDSKNHAFDFMSIIRTEKYNSFKNKESLEELAQQNSYLTISDILVKNPDNPAQLIQAKLIQFFVNK